MEISPSLWKFSTFPAITLSNYRFAILQGKRPNFLHTTSLNLWPYPQENDFLEFFTGALIQLIHSRNSFKRVLGGYLRKSPFSIAQRCGNKQQSTGENPI